MKPEEMSAEARAAWLSTKQSAKRPTKTKHPDKTTIVAAYYGAWAGVEDMRAASAKLTAEKIKNGHKKMNGYCVVFVLNEDVDRAREVLGDDAV